MSAVRPGRTQRVTATRKTIRVLRSPLENEPRLLRSWATYSSAPERRRTSGRFKRIRMVHSAMNMSKQIGIAVTTQLKKLILTSVACSIKAIPIRLGGDPIGVSSPPTPAA
jgi:hypothetical protein